jgi:hypothetical protein
MLFFDAIVFAAQLQTWLFSLLVAVQQVYQYKKKQHHRSGKYGADCRWWYNRPSRF